MQTHKGKRNPGKQIVRLTNEESGDRCVSDIQHNISLKGQLFYPPDPSIIIKKLNLSGSVLELSMSCLYQVLIKDKPPRIGFLYISYYAYKFS
jgi:hypothetical protein